MKYNVNIFEWVRNSVATERVWHAWDSRNHTLCKSVLVFPKQFQVGVPKVLRKESRVSFCVKCVRNFQRCTGKDFDSFKDGGKRAWVKPVIVDKAKVVCKNKQKYKSELGAMRALSRVRADRVKKGATKFESNAYPCNKCKQWHLTSRM